MGSVIFNADLQKILNEYLKKNQLLNKNIDFEKLNLHLSIDKKLKINFIILKSNISLR